MEQNKFIKINTITLVGGLKMDKETLRKRFHSYLERIEKKEGLDYPLEEKSYWRFIGGLTNEINRKEIPEIFHGTFEDAVMYALQQSNFYGEMCDENDLNHLNHGSIKKARIVTEKDIKVDLIDRIFCSQY